MEENVETSPEKVLSPSEAHEAKQQGSIFSITDEPRIEESDVANEEDKADEWNFADGIKGEGPRPAWLKEKYKTVSDQASAYSELEKKLGEFKGAPKDGYAFDEQSGVNLEDPLLQKFLPKFKELNMSQDAVNALVSEFSQHRSSVDSIDVKEEIKKLGPQGQDMINKTNQWMRNNLEPDVMETVMSWVRTADDMKALNALRSFQPLSRSPTSNDLQATTSYETLAEVKNEKTTNWTRYKEDENYRNSVNDRMEKAIYRKEAQKKR